MKINKFQKAAAVIAGILFIVLITGADEKIYVPGLSEPGRVVEVDVVVENPPLAAMEIKSYTATPVKNCALSPLRSFAIPFIEDDGTIQVTVGGVTQNSNKFTVLETQTITKTVSICAPMGTQKITIKVKDAGNNVVDTMTGQVVVA